MAGEVVDVKKEIEKIKEVEAVKEELVEEIAKEIIEEGIIEKNTKELREEELKEIVKEKVERWLDFFKNIEKYIEECAIEEEKYYDMGWTLDSSKLRITKDLEKLEIGTLDGFKVVANGFKNIIKWLVKEYIVEEI